MESSGIKGSVTRLAAAATAFLLSHPRNAVAPEDALAPALAGMPIFDAPLFAAASADDPLFAAMKAAVHADYPLPADWLPGARSVVSFFAPFTKQVKDANEADPHWPADEWLHARIEGEAMLRLLREFVCQWLERAGYAATAPAQDPRFRMLAPYASNWSERHTGYVCGLGTFGLSKGLLTARGVAGRIGGVVTTCPLPPTGRPYGEVYGYCAFCGACASNCPAGCIDPAQPPNDAKAHPPCDAFLERVRKANTHTGKARYGCGKCQVGAPCRDGIP